MARRKIHIVCTFDGKWWTVEAPFLEGAYSQGRTRQSARRNLMGAIRDPLASCADLGASAPTSGKADVELADLVA